MSNPYEIAGRAAKTAKFVAALQAGKIDADAAESMWDLEWTLVSNALGMKKPPSVETRAAVIKALRFAESLTERAV